MEIRDPLAMLNKLFNIFKRNRSFFDNKVKLATEHRFHATLAESGFLSIEDSKEQDVFIVGYPKSGNTWVQFMMTCIVNGIHPDYLNVSIVISHYKLVIGHWRNYRTLD